MGKDINRWKLKKVSGKNNHYSLWCGDYSAWVSTHQGGDSSWYIKATSTQTSTQKVRQ